MYQTFKVNLNIIFITNYHMDANVIIQDSFYIEIDPVKWNRTASALSQMFAKKYHYGQLLKVS